MTARLFVADDKFPDVIAQLLSRGWTRFPHDTFPNFDLRWTNYAKIAWPRVRLHQIVNHFHGAVVLSRKNELAARLYRGDACIKVDAFFPRTLDLVKRGDKEKLVAWFLYARAVGVVRAVLEQATASVRGNDIRAATAFLRRMLQLDGYFSCWSSDDVDLSLLEIESDQWTPLKRMRQAEPAETTTELEALSEPNWNELETICHRLRQLDSQFDCIAAGHGDVWICKPSNLSQGRGIHLLTDLDALLQLAPLLQTEDVEKPTVNQDQAETSAAKSTGAAPSWMVQKYVERPLLLQQNGKTAHKFDVRQWVLITSLDPLTVYWYKDCYLRFCAHAFTLEKKTLGDSYTHLSNYSIQKDATLDASSDNHHAFEPMWLSSHFRDVLRRDHRRDVWNDTILPRMQHAALTAIKAALPEMRPIGRGFEWLGIDFLIDADFGVWLLEVNVSPDVSHSTEVTGSLVPDATRGVLELVVGRESTSEQSANGWIKLDVFHE